MRVRAPRPITLSLQTSLDIRTGFRFQAGEGFSEVVFGLVPFAQSGERLFGVGKGAARQRDHAAPIDAGASDRFGCSGRLEASVRIAEPALRLRDECFQTFDIVGKAAHRGLPVSALVLERSDQDGRVAGEILAPVRQRLASAL